MSRLLNQLQASFKGIPFPIRNETLDDIGQKRILHEYPNSNIQYLEPKGKAPFNATIDIFFSGDNFREDFDEFKRAIEDPAPGRLILPTFGVFHNIVASQTSAASSQTSIGEISLSVKFSVTVDRPAPIQTQITTQDVAQQAQNVRDALKEEFEVSFEEPSFLSSIQTAINDALGMSEDLKKITGEIRKITSFVRKVSSTIKDAKRYADLLLSPNQPEGILQALAFTEIGSEAFSLYQEMSTLGNSLSNSMTDIINKISPKESTIVPPVAGPKEVNKNINLWGDDTFERRQRNQIRLSQINTFRVVGLVGMFERAASRTYTTVNQIDDFSNILENQYQELIENDTTGVIIPNIKDVLYSLKNLSDEVLKNKRQQAYKVIEVYLEKPLSASLLAYELYGEYIANESQLDFMRDLVKGLNTSQPAHSLIGVVQVVEIG